MPGRPKKCKQFKGTPIKNRDIEISTIPIIIKHCTRQPGEPLRLLNTDENVCFANAVFQLLYALPDFRSRVQFMFLHENDACITSVSRLFQAINNNIYICSNTPIRTSSYVHNMNFPGYIPREQHDSHSFLSHILNAFYPYIDTNCIFRVEVRSTITCRFDGHQTNTRTPCLDLCLSLPDHKNVRSVSSLLDNYISDEDLTDYTCPGCQKKGFCYKQTTLWDVGDILIMQLSIFDYKHGRPIKLLPKMNIEQHITINSTNMTLYGIIFHHGDNIHEGHYTCGMVENNTCYIISDSLISRKQNISGMYDNASGDTGIPYILMYKKTSVMNAVPRLLTAGMNEKGINQSKNNNAIYNIDFNRDESTPETMNRQSLVCELKTQAIKLNNADRKNVSPIKRKSKFVDKSSKKRVRVHRENLDDEQTSNANLATKKRMKTFRENLDDEQKNNKNLAAKKQMKTFRDTKQNQRNEAFLDVKNDSMVDPCILETTAYKLIADEFKSAIKEGPTYICNICWKFEYRKNVIILNPSKYEKNLYDECDTKKSEYICNSCHRSLFKKNKMPMQAQANNLSLFTDIEELKDLCPIEVMLISKIIPFMFIVAKVKGAQHGLKGQCVLVPTDSTKIQKVLPRSCDEKCLIALALKRRLSDKSSVNKQYVRPHAVNRALKKLIEINPFYNDVSIDSRWEDKSEHSDSKLWEMLTDNDTNAQQTIDENTDSDSDKDIDENNTVQQKELRMSSVPFPTALHNINGPNISANEIINIAPGENQIPVSFTSEPDWEALSFAQLYPNGKNHFGEKRKIYITPSKYVHTRLKSCDPRFASNTQYIFQTLDWIERNAVYSSIHFHERKRFQSDISVGQLNDSNNVSRMMLDDIIFAAFKNIRGTPQYFHTFLLDVLAKIRQFNVYTFFLTCSAAEFHWTEVIQVIARQYGEILTDEDVNNMDWNTKCKYLKRNPVTVARHIDYILKQLWGKVILSGMHPIGEILNYDDRREFQNRGAQHFHAPLHVVGAPRIDENTDTEVTEFIDKYITCSLPDNTKYPDLHNLVKKVQTHHHTKTCRKKKRVTCRFNAPWPPSEKTLIIRGNTDADKLNESKKIIDKVLTTITQISDLSSVTEKEIVQESGVSIDEYYDALHYSQSKLSVIYKRKPCETNIGPYNTVILSLLRANMNIQYVSGVYAMLTYLTSYLCKPEHKMSEFMKKASKEAYSKPVRERMYCISNEFIQRREVSTHEAIGRVLSFPLRHSNIDVIYIPTGLKENRTRMLKSQSVLDQMHEDDTNIYALNVIDKYENRPDSLEQLCLADFACNYVSTKADEKIERDDIRSYTIPVSGIMELPTTTNIIVLKNSMGKMRKRSRPCVMRFYKVSKIKDSEAYYLRIIQLYMPWRHENDLKHDVESYEAKYNNAKDRILSNLNKHEPNVEIDYEELNNHFIESDDEEEDNNEFSMLNPDLIDFDEEENGNSNISTTAPVSSSSIEHFLLSNDTFYEMCSQLNEKQQHLFNFIMLYANTCRFNDINGKIEPHPFHIFLSGGAGVGKSFEINVITEYLKRTLKFTGQTLSQPSVLVTASTGKAATGVNGITMHSAFKLPVRKSSNTPYKKPSDENLHELRIKYKYLKVLLTDEVSMTGNKTFSDLNIALQHIMENKSPFGGISVILIGDLLQLPPVKQGAIYMNAKAGSYDAFCDNLFQKYFKLHELTDIVRQSSDPEFAALLARLREGKHNEDDIQNIQMLADTDTSNWPNHIVKLYLTNYLAGLENEQCIRTLGTKIFTIPAKDSRKDVKTRTYSVPKISDKIPISATANLPGTLKICEGARFMLTDNVNIHDKLINGSIGTIKRLDFRRNLLDGSIYVQFDNPQTGNTYKDRRLRGILKECVPIKAITKEFEYIQGKNTVRIERKQYPGILAHAITIHKSQGSTIEYLYGNLDGATGKYNKNGLEYMATVNQGQFYTLLSRGKTRDHIKLVNFHVDHIRVNDASLHEMNRMREESMFSWKHPINDAKICLLNIRSWNKHIEHFLTDKNYSNCCYLFCFTETHTSTASTTIDKYLDGWLDIHKMSEHGLAICYNTNKVKIIQEFSITTSLEILPVLIQIENQMVLLIVVYRSGPVTNATINTFIDNLIIELNSLPTQHRILIVGDFNLDQLLPEHVHKFDSLVQQFKLYQRSQYSTHNQGGILDLVFDNKSSEIVTWLPSPYSDHFVLCIEI